MSASPNQAAEASKGTSDRKMGHPRKKILIRSGRNSAFQNLTITAEQGEVANNHPTRKELWKETNNNITCKRLSNEAKGNIPSKRPSEVANNNITSKKTTISIVPRVGASRNPSGLKLSTSAGQAIEPSSSTANLEAMKEYQEFKEKVKRTVYLDNLSHQVTEAVVKMALNQFGTVSKVSFLVNYTIPYDIPQSALVEMETLKDAESVVGVLCDFPFMMSGMPRPVRAQCAIAEMFHDRPRKPGSKFEFHWVGTTDNGYELVRKLRLLTKVHEKDNLALIKCQLEEEQMLVKVQQENLNSTYRKLEIVESLMLTGQVNQLCRIYGLDEIF